MASQRLGIPAIAHEECLTGLAAYGATAFPTPLAWAATFDEALVEQMARAIGEDMRAIGVHQGLAPVVDVVKDYRWGRVEETLGEDPYLVAQLGAAYVAGLEGAGIIATLKHFAGYAASRGARNHAPVRMGPRELADTVLPPFETAVRLGGARSVMTSYAELLGRILRRGSAWPPLSRARATSPSSWSATSQGCSVTARRAKGATRLTCGCRAGSTTW